MRDPEGEKEIERIERLFARSDFDVEECISYIDPEQFVGFDVMPSTIEGKESYAVVGKDGYATHLRHLVSNISNYELGVKKLEATASGGVGIVNSIQVLKTYDDSGAEVFSADIRVSTGYRKTGDRWMQISQHASVPVDLTTGTPIFVNKW